MEHKKVTNSQNNSKDKELNWRYHSYWPQIILQTKIEIFTSYTQAGANIQDLQRTAKTKHKENKTANQKMV